MQQVIKKSLWICGLVFSLQSAWAFSLIQPVASWQVNAIGYNPLFPDGLPIGPAALGEEYRRTTPVIYYAYDANFGSYFGLNGEAAVEQAISIMNSVSNVDSYSSALTEFPLKSKRVVPVAQALSLTDLKSTALYYLVEQMGLAAPTRYVWTLESRLLPTGATCPVGVEYLVVQRNYDITASPLNQIQASPYIDGELYDYEILEFCQTRPLFPNGPVLATTVPFPLDPLGSTFSPVAADEDFWVRPLPAGYIHTGLARDDVAGLRYIYSTNNINLENAAADSLEMTTNNATVVTLTTQSLGDLLAQAATNSPATLQTNFPGLEIGSSTNFFVNEITTNISLFFTNTPGPSITNFQPIQLITTLDLGLLNSQAQTNSPAQLLALYPGLIIVSSTPYFTNILTPNIVVTFKQVNGAPPGTVKVVTTTNGFTPNFLERFTYVFGNIFTNSFSPNSFVTIQTVTIQTPVGYPVGTGSVTNTPPVTKILTHTPTGDFFIMPTNWCGFKVTQRLYTNAVFSTSNTVTLSNFVSGVSQFTGSQTTFTGYTNHTFVIEPGICEPTLAFATNYTTNIVVRFQTTFANIVTNSFFTNSSVTILTTNIGACSNGVDGTLCTNVTSKTVIQTNVPSGDFFIPPANWCGYTILSTLQANVVGTTNTVTATIPPGINNIGQQFSVTTISSFTNHTFLIQPQTCQTFTSPAQKRQGVGRIRFVRVADSNVDPLSHNFLVPVTNNYTMVLFTNNQLVTQTFQRIVARPDILFDAQDRPGSPQNFQAVFRNLNFNSSQALPGFDGPGTIEPSTTITFNSLAPIQFRSSTGTNQFNEATLSLPFTYLAWGSFDLSTNDPVVYPNGTSIQNLENQAVVQISPATLPDGTNGVAYGSVTFSVTGGQPPYTWSLAAGSQLPQGLSLSAAGFLSGTPSGNPPGIYDFTLQLNDSSARTVQWNYSITIQ